MRSVAQGCFGAVFTSTEKDLARFFCRIFHGAKFGAFVAAITIGLFCAFATGALEICFALFHFCWQG